LPVYTDKKQAIRGGLAGIATRFKPGQSGNPAGRPKGSRNKLSEDFFRDFCALWEEHGFNALEWMAKRNRPAFAVMAASLLPKSTEVSGPQSGPIVIEQPVISDADRARALAVFLKRNQLIEEGRLPPYEGEAQREGSYRSE
jgi:hypothetical protein